MNQEAIRRALKREGFYKIEGFHRKKCGTREPLTK